MKQKMVTFYRIMNGYEFIEFMRKFGWKHNGHYKKQTLTDDELAYYKLSSMRKKFEGWEYWFNAPFPTDLFKDEQEITFRIQRSRWCYWNIEDVLHKNGFREKE